MTVFIEYRPKLRLCYSTNKTQSGGLCRVLLSSLFHVDTSGIGSCIRDRVGSVPAPGDQQGRPWYDEVKHTITKGVRQVVRQRGREVRQGQRGRQGRRVRRELRGLQGRRVQGLQARGVRRVQVRQLHQ